MKSLKDVLPSVLAGFEKPEHSIKKKIWNEWAAIMGPKLAPHTRPSVGRHGQLFIWVDQSSLAFELSQRYRQTILKRVQAVAGEDQIQDIIIRVGQLR